MRTVIGSTIDSGQSNDKDNGRFKQNKYWENRADSLGSGYTNCRHDNYVLENYLTIIFPPLHHIPGINSNKLNHWNSYRSINGNRYWQDSPAIYPEVFRHYRNM